MSTLRFAFVVVVVVVFCFSLSHQSRARPLKNLESSSFVFLTLHGFVWRSFRRPTRRVERERGSRTSLDACEHEDDDDDSETGTVASKIGSVFGKVPNPGNRN